MDHVAEITDEQELRASADVENEEGNLIATAVSTCTRV
jgi:hypothetical protein